MTDPNVIRIVTVLHRARTEGSPVASPSEAVLSGRALVVGRTE